MGNYDENQFCICIQNAVGIKERKESHCFMFFLPVGISNFSLTLCIISIKYDKASETDYLLQVI